MSWPDFAVLVVAVAASGIVWWVCASLIAMFTFLTITSLDIWRWPTPPDEQLDEIFPGQRDFLQGLRSGIGRLENYTFRYAIIVQLLMAGLFVVARLQTCDEPWNVLW